MIELNNLRPFHQHSERCLDIMSMSQVANQVSYGLCSAVKHTDCDCLTELDLFRKRAKECRQRVALEEPGV